MQSNALQGRSEKLNKDEYRIYYVGLTRAKKNLQYTEFVSEKVDYKKFLNKREFIPSYNGIFIGRKGDVIWSNLPERYLNDMSQKWFSCLRDAPRKNVQKMYGKCPGLAPASVQKMLKKCQKHQLN